MIINKGGTLKFTDDSNHRMHINDCGDGVFLLCNTASGANIWIDQKDIDDMIVLLTEVKNNGYEIA